MKITDLLNKIDINAIVNKGENYRLDDMMYEFDFGNRTDHDKVIIQKRFYGAYISVKYCTDSWVGLIAYVFDNKIVAISYQKGRKYDKEILWVSKDDYENVKEFCNYFVIKKKVTINLIDDMEIHDDGYHLDYSDQLIPNIHKTAKFNDETVSIIKATDSIGFLSECVIIKYSDGRLGEEHISNLLFPYNYLKK